MESAGDHTYTTYETRTHQCLLILDQTLFCIWMSVFAVPTRALHDLHRCVNTSCKYSQLGMHTYWHKVNLFDMHKANRWQFSRNSLFKLTGVKMKDLKKTADSMDDVQLTPFEIALLGIQALLVTWFKMLYLHPYVFRLIGNTHLINNTCGLTF